MDNKDWELLRALREGKSAAKAGEKLRLSQPAVTYRLNRLEDEMGAELFIKSNRGVMFTSAGERLLSYAEKMASQYNEMLEYVRYEGGVQGTVNMGAPPFFSTKFLPTLFLEFRTLYPKVTLKLHSGLSSELMDLLRRQEILLSVVRGRHPWDEGSIPVFKETIKIVSAKPLTLDELPETPFIGYRTDAYLQGQIDSWWLENFTTPRNILINTHNSYSCIEFVKAGLGFSIVPSISVPEDERLFTMPILNIKGEPYLRPTRLLFYNKVRNLDVYNVFIEFFQSKMINAKVA